MGKESQKTPMYLKILASQQQLAKSASEKSRKEEEKALSEIKTMRLFYCYVSLGIQAYIRGVWHACVYVSVRASALSANLMPNEVC